MNTFLLFTRPPFCSNKSWQKPTKLNKIENSGSYNKFGTHWKKATLLGLQSVLYYYLLWFRIGANTVEIQQRKQQSITCLPLGIKEIVKLSAKNRIISTTFSNCSTTSNFQLFSLRCLLLSYFFLSSNISQYPSKWRKITELKTSMLFLSPKVEQFLKTSAADKRFHKSFSYKWAQYYESFCRKWSSIYSHPSIKKPGKILFIKPVAKKLIYTNPDTQVKEINMIKKNIIVSSNNCESVSKFLKKRYNCTKFFHFKLCVTNFK